jgi:predicted nucleic acid-binding protein
MILVDTSVIIDFLNGKENTKVSLFDKVLENKIPYGINAFIFQEVLQGARDLKEYTNLREYLESIPFYYLKMTGIPMSKRHLSILLVAEMERQSVVLLI